MAIDGLQYERRISLILADNAGNGIDLSTLRITFRTNQSDLETPNNAIATVYNLSDETARSIVNPSPSGPEYTRMVLQAGYDGNFGIIFDGTIKQARKGRESNIDSYVEIFAADGDLAYNFGYLNQSLAAGSTGRQRLEAIVQGFAKASPGVTVGYAPDVPLGPPLARGKVLFGMARDPMRDLARTANSSWSVQNGKVSVVPETSYVPGDAVVLSANTGMIGIPEQTAGGIQVRCLLNPKIVVGGLVQINNTDINAARINIQYTAINNLAAISADGFYKVYVAEHQGDTRGRSWYSDLTCLSVDASAPPANSVNPYTP